MSVPRRRRRLTPERQRRLTSAGWLCAFLALTVASACADGSVDLSGELTQEDAARLLTALSAVYLPSPSPPSPAPTPADAALVPTTTLVIDTTEVTISCPSGGSATAIHTDSISITVDVRLNPTPDTSFVSESDYSGETRAEVQYVGCSATDGMGGVWTFDATPGLALDLDLEGSVYSVGLTSGTTYSATTSDWQGSWNGTLGWAHGGRSGSCTFDLLMTASTAVADGQSTYSFSQSGQICGVSVSTSS